MTLTLELPDEQAAALEAKAAAQGFSLQEWLERLASSQSNSIKSLDWSQCPGVESVPERVSGAWVFRNTRMPVSAVFENLEDGLTIDELVELYDGLTREHVETVLAFAAKSLKTRSTGTTE